jgi:hypothetical protein
MKRLLISLILVISAVAPATFLAPAPAYASAFGSSDAKKQACSGISGKESAGECEAPGRSLSDIVASVLNFLSAIIGIVAVVMVMVGGFKYITASGDSSKASGARSTIIYALIGLLIVAFAQFITQFVLDRVANDSGTSREERDKED